MKNIMLVYLIKLNLFSKNQFGFLQEGSTDKAIFEHVSYISQGLEEGRSVISVYFDIRKAFDTIDHTILLKKLYKYGFRRNMYNWFKSYLENRRYIVKINNIYSDTMVQHTGVPQGSVLGPYLFLIYINDLCNLPVNGRLFSYADDTAMVVDSRYPSLLQKLAQENVNNIFSWLKRNRLVVNSDKTKYVVYSNQESINWNDFELLLNDNVKLNMVSEIKYLGIQLDRKLIWSGHAFYLSEKLRKLNYLFYYLKQFLSPVHMRRMYLALYQPVLAYGILNWGGMAKYHIKPIKVLQRAVMRMIIQDKLPFNVYELYRFRLLTFVVNNSNRFNITISESRTRSGGSANAELPFINKSRIRNQAVHAGPTMYNALPRNLKFDLLNFKRRRKKLLINYIRGL